MSHSNNTTNYSLPNFIATDKPGWMSDINPAMTAIDTAMHNNATAASENAADIAAVENRLESNLPNTGTAGTYLQKTASGAAWAGADTALDASSTNAITNKAVTENAVTTKNTANITNNMKYLDVNGDTVFPYVLEDAVLNANGEQALHDSGWLTLTISHASPIHYRKKGGVVSIEIPNQQFTGLTANADTLLGTLPVGYRPRDMFIVQGYNDAFLMVQTDGQILIHTTRSQQYASFLITFMAVGE